MVLANPHFPWRGTERFWMAQLTVTVDTGHGPKSHTFYTTRWGPVIDLPEAGYHWTTTNAYALADSTAGDTFRAANQYLRMGQATSVKDLLAVESAFLAIPTFNTIGSDDTGHALYADVGNTPNVPQSLIDTCLPAGTAQLVFKIGGVVTLDGSRADCSWGNDPGTPVPGIFSAAHEPHTIRTDYVENSNDSYWLANPSAPFPAFSPIIGKIDTVQGLRTRSGNEMSAKRVAGTDGFGPPKFTIPSLQKMWRATSPSRPSWSSRPW